MENIIRIKGIRTNCCSNFDVEHTKRLIKLLEEEHLKKPNDLKIMELIAGFTFAITGDFDSILDEESTRIEDRIKTIENIEKIYYNLNK